MGPNLRLSTGLKTFSLASLLAVTTTPALGQNLNINSDTVTVTSGGGFNQALAIPATGILPNITIPTAGISGGAAVPNFAFTMESTSVGDGSYDFSAAFVIDDNNSARRLEVMIPTITMTFSGGGTVLNGSVAAGSTVTVLGRAADNTTQLSATLANTLFNFSGTTLSFTAGAQVTEIASKGGILGDIATTISDNGTYTYAVVLKQKSGAQVLTLGRETGGFTPFGCAPSGTFVLNSNQFSSLSGGFGLQGQFIAGAGAFGAAPTQFSATCTTNIPSSGGGGGGDSTTPEGQTTAVSTTTTNLSASITANGFTDEAATQLATLVTDTTAAATSVGEGIKAGTVTVQTGIDLFNSMGTQVSILENAFDAIDGNDPAANTKLAQINSSAIPLLNSMKSLLSGFRQRTITSSERTQLLASINSFTTVTRSLLAAAFTNLGLQTQASALSDTSAITVSTLVADLTTIVDSYSAGLSDLLSAPGFTMDSSLFSNAQALSQTVAEKALPSLGTDMGLSVTYTNDTAARTLLASNTTLLSRLIDAIGVELGNSIEVNATTTNAAFVAAGVTGSFVASLTTDMGQFVKADGLQVDSGSGLATASSTLQTALGADTLTVNATTGAINYTNGGSTSVAFLKTVMAAPSIVPTGTHVLSDGSTLINDGQLLYILVSGSNSILDFAGAIHSVGAGTFSTGITASGVIKLTETASGAVFSSTMSTSPIATATATSATTFEAPSGDPAASSYRFVVQYSDGTRQEILPAMADAAFYQSVGNAGFQVTTDRRTGTVDIAGFNFRPDFFLTPLTTDDAIYLTTNADTSGVAYRAVDANGDGRTDYQVLTAAGVQTVYGLP